MSVYGSRDTERNIHAATLCTWGPFSPDCTGSTRTPACPRSRQHTPEGHGWAASPNVLGKQNGAL